MNAERPCLARTSPFMGKAPMHPIAQCASDCCFAVQLWLSPSFVGRPLARVGNRDICRQEALYKPSPSTIIRQGEAQCDEWVSRERAASGFRMKGDSIVIVSCRRLSFQAELGTFPLAPRERMYVRASLVAPDRQSEESETQLERSLRRRGGWNRRELCYSSAAMGAWLSREQ
jgi:hypothetical protein